MLPTAQAGARDARDAPGNRGCSSAHLAALRFLWTAEHRFHRAGEFDRPARNSCAGPPYLGHSTAVSTPARPAGVVARRLTFRTSSCSTASGTGAATRTGWQDGGTALPPAYSSYGSRQNHPTMVGARGAVPSLIAGAMRPHRCMNNARRLLRKSGRRFGEEENRDRSVDGADEAPSPERRLRRSPA